MHFWFHLDQGRLVSRRECHTWDGAGSNWTRAFSLQTPRAWAASVLVPGDTRSSLDMVIIGGVNTNNQTLATIERISLSKRRSVLSNVRLPLPLSGHCAVQINSTHTFITGATNHMHHMRIVPSYNVICFRGLLRRSCWVIWRQQHIKQNLVPD